MPSCHPSLQWLHSSATCWAGKFAGEQCTVYSCVGMLQWPKCPPSKMLVPPHKRPSHGGSGLYCSLDPHELTHQTVFRSVWTDRNTVWIWIPITLNSVFYSSPVCSADRHRHIDYATCETCNNRPHICTMCRQCGLKFKIICCCLDITVQCNISG